MDRVASLGVEEAESRCVDDQLDWLALVGSTGVADSRDPEMALAPRLRLGCLDCVAADGRPDVFPEDRRTTDPEMDVHVRAQIFAYVDDGSKASVPGCVGRNCGVLDVLGPDAEDHALADKRRQGGRIIQREPTVAESCHQRAVRSLEVN